jgi:3-hydroxybutyryl-CoA dehydrogenase
VRDGLGIAGSGAIACGLAATAAAHADVVLWARSPASAGRARATVDRMCSRLPESDPTRVTVTQELGDLGRAPSLVEAIAEDHDLKVALLRDLSALGGPDALLATTTSSLSVERLAADAGDVQERFVGLHVFNPVPRMQLVELAFPAAATELTRARARGLCEKLGKVPVEVPDVPGFVVNRLLFPFLFSAVALLEETGLEPVAIDRCMHLGAGHPIGPLALLDLVGLDVSIAIGETIGAPIPGRLRALAAEGALGKKAGRGFYDYAED